MSFELPPLPYAQDALEPLMSARTLSFHYGKHHAGYVKKLNAAIEGTDNATKSLEEIIMSASGGLFNNAAQVWNHTFFWNCLKPNGGGAPTGDLADAINRDFGSFDEFKKQFAAAAGGQFGSGWGWLVLDGGKLKVVSTGNADLPMKHGQTALFTVDVWEHAYYLDYQNARPDFINTILDKLANWDFVAKNLAEANSAAS
jgi:Fe-Mn family superoxide dismutase